MPSNDPRNLTSPERVRAVIENPDSVRRNLQITQSYHELTVAFEDFFGPADRFAHTNIIARDWRRLAAFYVEVFDCTLQPPRRQQSGEWLERGTGVHGAALEGVHLLLPGHGDQGPTLEIYTYLQIQELAPGAANRRGFSLVLMTSWNSRPLICCKSCGVKAKLGDAAFCLFLGWWVSRGA